MEKKKENDYSIITTEKIKEIEHKENYGEKLTRKESIWFSRLPGIRKAGISFGMTKEEVEEYAKCKLSVYYFAERYCNIKLESGEIGKIKLRNYQKEMMNLFNENRYSILMCSRQSGKTIAASIFILWTALFQNDKGVMIVANVSATVKEIIRKIKDIYKLLPFFLKKGVINWNERSVAFENGSRIQTANRTKDPAIGFTIDLLYIDEFAKVPNSIIRAYYSSVIPTISSLTNSKIIITSTPDGYNLFWELLRDAERQDEDPLKGMYKALRVYWWQIKGRRDTKLTPLAYKFKEYNLKLEEVIEQLKSLGYEMYEKVIDSKKYTMIKWDDTENTNISYLRSLRLDNIPLSDLFMMTNWQEEETKLIGGEDAFKQEYDLLFITGNKLLFDTEQLERFQTMCSKFEHIPIDNFDKKMYISYTNLKWIKDMPELFNMADVKKYRIVISLDLSEGLGQDYSIINIFRLLPKSKEIIEKQNDKYANIYDYFKLEQIGVFKSNVYHISELAQLFYLIAFELFDPEKAKVVLEYNTYGSDFLTNLLHVFEDKNNYSNGVFLRYKHRQEDTMLKIGLKITGGDHNAAKKQLITDFQAAVKKNSIVLHNDMNINEIRMFSRKDTPSGDFTYQCESGNDDMVMSCITLCTAFKHTHFKDMIDTYIQHELDFEFRKMIELFVSKRDDGSAVNYLGAVGIHSKIYGNKKTNNKNQPISFGYPGSSSNFPLKPQNSPWKR